MNKGCWPTWADSECRYDYIKANAKSLIVHCSNCGAKYSVLLGESAFATWRGLTSLKFDSNTCRVVVKDQAFAGAGLKSIVFTGRTEALSLYSYAFANCKNLTSLSIPNFQKDSVFG